MNLSMKKAILMAGVGVCYVIGFLSVLNLAPKLLSEVNKISD